MDDIKKLVNTALNKTEKLKERLANYFVPDFNQLQLFVRCLLYKHKLAISFISYVTGIPESKVHAIAFKKKYKYNIRDARLIWFLYLAYEQPGAFYEPDKDFFISAWGLPSTTPQTSISVNKYKETVLLLEQIVDKGGNVNDIAFANAAEIDVGIAHYLMQFTGLNSSQHFYRRNYNPIFTKSYDFPIIKYEQHSLKYTEVRYFLRPMYEFEIKRYKNNISRLIYKDTIVAKHRILGIQRYFSDELDIDIWKQSGLYEAEKTNYLPKLIGFRYYSSLLKNKYPLRMTFILTNPIETYLTTPF